MLVILLRTTLILSAQNPVPVYLDPSKSVGERVENALSLMTTEEKVALCHAQSKFSSKGVARLGIPEIWMSDGPHGVRAEIEWDSWGYANFTNDSCLAFPALTCLASTFNPELAARYGKAIGEEARYRKKEVILGPGVNIYRSPLNGRNFEYMGEDPYLASKMVVPYVQGVQKSGVAACVKHFALNNQENWRGHIDVELSDRALYEIYLPAFKAAVMEGKAWSIMGSYNKFRGEHCCHNDLLLNKILKTDWEFDGAVITDWGGAHDDHQAAMNGLDIEMGTGTDGLTTSVKNAYDYYHLANPLLKAVKNGDVPMEVLNDKARRVLRLIFRTSMNPNRPWGSFVTPEHSKVASDVAKEGIVLLKNDQNVLPVNPKLYKKILVVGENATRKMTIGGGSSELKTQYEISPLQGIKNAFGSQCEVNYAMGYASGPSAYGREIPSKLNADTLLNEAVRMANDADLILYVGGLNKNHFQDCEGGDRKTYELPFGQNKLIGELIRTNKKVVVVIVSGNAVSMPWVNQVPAIVQAWYLGSESGNAIASVLSGETNPSGKLPFTFGVKLNDYGAHSFDKLCFPGDSIKEVYKEDILVGYRWFDTKNIVPQFPFGYGLSYTTFQIGKASVDKTKYAKNDVVKLSVTLTNSGKLDGAEVIQAYIQDKVSSVPRPTKELKGFSKVDLKAGESKVVTLELPVSEWGFYDETSKQFKVEHGQFVINLGTSSRDIKQQIPVTVE
ncbi:beta-glucosidase [Aquipluma nitroreducens]|uniref:Beta-glucosidase n=2 Tax=Aquipluma nitroreducens TaxID=2010828 RepID=A0A5K7SAZ4_9BACT|nr:beta-glucosidase [Aquipluma nitroreducens]